MFKKIVCSFLLFIFLIQINFGFKVFAELSIDSLPAEAYIVMDANSGQIIFEKNSDEKRAIASLTKIMIMLLVAEKIDNKELSLNQKLVATNETTTKIKDETSLWLAPGEEMTVEDLFKAVSIKSANDAARTLGLYLSDGVSQAGCVKLMNEKARQLGMTNTHFENSSGLDQENHYSTAHDVAIMTREILKNHPWVKKYTSTKEDYVRDGTAHLINTNFLMLKEYKGCTGFKTGTTDMAGKCLCSTVERDGMSLISVCLGCANREDTMNTNKALLNYTFNNFRPLDVRNFKYNPEVVNVVGGKYESVYGVVGNEVATYPLINKRLVRKVKNKVTLSPKVDAPIRKGDVVGNIKYIVDGKDIYTQNLVADRDVEKINWFFIFSSMFKNFFCCKNI